MSRSSRVYYFLLIYEFSPLKLADGFLLSDSKSPGVSRTLLSILADLNNTVVWMVSTCPLIFKLSSPCINPLVTAPKAPITIGINDTFMFHDFFNSLARLGYLPFFVFWFFFFVFFRFLSILFCSQPGRQRPQFSKSSFFLFFFLFFFFFLTWSSGRD